MNQIVPGISFSGEITVTDEEVSLIEVNNLRLIKDEIEKEVSMAISLINKGNVPESLDLIELMIHNEKNELVHTEGWTGSDEIPAFQDEEFIYEVDLPRLSAGNYSIQISALEDGEWIYESSPLPYQVIGKAQTDWIFTLLLLAMSSLPAFAIGVSPATLMIDNLLAGGSVESSVFFSRSNTNGQLKYTLQLAGAEADYVSFPNGDLLTFEEGDQQVEVPVLIESGNLATGTYKEIKSTKKAPLGGAF